MEPKALPSPTKINAITFQNLIEQSDAINKGFRLATGMLSVWCIQKDEFYDEKMLLKRRTKNAQSHRTTFVT
jgi:hypothetical protein